MNGDHPTQADIASSNAYDSLRKIEALQKRVETLEALVASLTTWKDRVENVLGRF